MNESLSMPKNGRQGKRPRKFNLDIPSVFEVFAGSSKENGISDIPKNMLFLPSEENLARPIARDTSALAKKWAMSA